RGLLEVAERDVVGVGVARPRVGLGPDPGALADVARGFFDNVFLENQLLVDAVLEVDVGVIHPADQAAAQQAFYETWSDVETIGEEALRLCASEVCHSS